MQTAVAVSRTLSRTPLKDEPSVIAQALFSERQRHAEVMEEVRKVLEAFAKAADGVGTIWDDAKPIQDLRHACASVTIGNLRATRTLLSKLGER